MHKLFFFLPFLLLAACRQTWYKTPSGLTYRIIEPGKSDNNNNNISATGCTVKFIAGKDPVPKYLQIIPGVVLPYDVMEIFVYGQHEGDSIVVVQRLDSMVAKGLLRKLPEGKKGGDEISTYVRLLKVFPRGGDSLVVDDKKIEQHKLDSLQSVLGPIRLAKYIHEKNIDAKPLKDGSWIEIIQPEKNQIVANIQTLDSGTRVLMNVRLNLPNGTLVSQRDSVPYTIGTKGLPKMVDSAIRGFSAGSHFRIYIPTMLAYGAHPPMNGIPVYGDLIFDISILKTE